MTDIYGLNPTDDEAALLQGLFMTVGEFDRDDIISAGEWLWQFLSDFHWRVTHIPPWREGTRTMDAIRDALTSSDYDMDLTELMELGRARYADRHHDTGPDTRGDLTTRRHAEESREEGTPPPALRVRRDGPSKLVKRWTDGNRRGG